MSIKIIQLAPLLAGLLLSCAATAQTTYSDNFSGATSSLKWLALNDACLTAGSASKSTGVIPGCSKIGVSAPADAVGLGALRLTPAQDNQTGAILSNFTFPLSQGMQVTFTTYTYGGDSQSSAKDGADGISFMLTDGTKAAPTVAGGLGGSLGYSCSNTNSTYEGMADAYLGLGIDEYGNFLNNGDNTNTGILNSRATGGTTAYGDNSYAGGGPQYQPQRIGLRGAGNTTWAWLQAQNPTYYSGSVDATKTRAACQSGTYLSGYTYTYDKHGNVKTKTPVYSPITYNYNAISDGYQVLPTGTLIANEGTSTRAGNPSAPADYTKNAWPLTYKLTLSPTGLLNFAYSYNNGAFQPVLANKQITDSNGPLPASFRFGFSAGTGGSNNVHEITCFQASPLQSNSSASANTVQSGQVKIGSQIYLASYSSDNWFGALVSNSLVTSGTTLSVSNVANWDARCVLTGGLCAAMGTNSSGTPTTSITAEGPSARTLLTWDDVGGTAQPLEWVNLTTAQQSALNGADSAGASRLKWLRGDRTVEQLATPTPGTLRARTAVLGDIIDSSPTWVGAPVAGANPDIFTDGIYGSAVTPAENATGAQAYSSFASSNATRVNVVYVGGNDGFLHGFRAGSYDTSGNYTSVNGSGTYVGTDNDGKEVVGFMPSAVLSKVAATTTGLTSPTYVHDYFVDATPTAADLFYGNAWHTWLVGGVGTGGNEIYALDITSPDDFAESAASTIVKGDWTSATTGLSHLGQTVGSPIIVRMHSGQWAIIFGNGLNSGTSAGVYVGLVNSSTGAVTFQFLDTGTGSATSANGIAYVASSDLDGDHIADYLYAGDLQGNVWRFDVTSKTAASWGVSKFGNSGSTPLFIAKNASGTVQPITTAPVIAAVNSGSANRVMVLFGTGQKIPQTATAADVYTTGQQTYYGIWDWDMGAWNTLSGTSSLKYQYASLTGTHSVVRTSLLASAVVSTAAGAGGTSTVLGYRNLSTTNVVCWQGSTTCASGNNKYGWLFDLPATQEQIIYNSAIVGGAVVVSTAIPPVISALQCNPGLQSGWTMAFDPASGGALPDGFFPDGNGSFGTNSDGSAIGGIRVDAVGSPTAVTYGGQTYIVTQTVSGAAALSPVNPPSNDVPSRISWRELRN